jgi:hypothetical protein
MLREKSLVHMVTNRLVYSGSGVRRLSFRELFQFVPSLNLLVFVLLSFGTDDLSRGMRPDANLNQR